MTIRKLERSDRAQAEVLWQEIFNDLPTFTTYYFDVRFEPEHSFGAFDGDRLIAMVLGRSTPIRIEGAVRSALLIAGVSTDPAYRGQGWMRELMTRLIDHARAAGFSCCYLHPVQESLYASLGFRNGADALAIRSDPNRAHKPFDLREGERLFDMLSVYNALLASHDGMQLRDEAELKTVLKDYATEDARTLIAYAEQRPVGYICWSENGTVFELLARCAPAYEALLDAAAERAHAPLEAVVPTDCGIDGERRCGMQYLVFDNAFRLPLQNGFCSLGY